MTNTFWFIYKQNEVSGKIRLSFLKWQINETSFKK